MVLVTSERFRKQKMIPMAWYDSWKEFCGELQALVLQGMDLSVFSNSLAAQTVKWSGELVGKSLEFMSPYVEVKLSPLVLEVRPGQLVRFEYLALPIAKDSREEWAAIEVGSTVKFRATFLGNQSVLKPLEITVLESGRVLLDIRVADSKPLIDS